MDRRITFENIWEYKRALSLLEYYQYSEIPLKYSKYINLERERRDAYLERLRAGRKKIAVYANCLMPNHFHLLLQQLEDNGIASFISDFVNAYTRYYNTKHERTGALFQGTFKAVSIENDEQLIHVHRYITINAPVASIIEPSDLSLYPWCSYNAFRKRQPNALIDQSSIDIIRSLIPDYEAFIMDQIDYAKTLSGIKHLLLE